LSLETKKNNKYFMKIIQLLASSQGHKGSESNIALAREIASNNNTHAIKELVLNLKNKDKRIQSDCIKTLYETACINPKLIADYYPVFLSLLKSKNNRLVWGGMIALYNITDLKPKQIFEELDLIMSTIEKGSVITSDCGIEILSRLSKFKDYSQKTEPLLIEQLWNCPIKQLPMYVEKAMICINSNNNQSFKSILASRLAECEKESQKIRLEKILKRIEKL